MHILSLSTALSQRDPNLKGNTSIPAFDPSWRPEETESWDDDSEGAGGI